MAELLLQFGADPNSGGKRPYQQNASCYVLTDEGEEEEEEEEEEGEGELEQRRVLTAVRNEGDSKITPLHMLCGVTLPKSEDERGEVTEIIPELIEILVNHGADVNTVSSGYSPLALAIAKGHDIGVHVLLQNGADPNLPLGRGVCNALCTLTSQAAHKARALVSPLSCLSLIHILMLFGADIFRKVKLPLVKGGEGTVLDYAHAAFREDKRIFTVKYDNLSKAERARYKASKRLTAHLRNLFRCKAFYNLAIRDDIHHTLQSKLKDNTIPEITITATTTTTKSVRIHSTPSTGVHTPLTSVSSALPPPSSILPPPPPLSEFITVDRTSRSACASLERRVVTPISIWLPDVTLSLSLSSLNKTVHGDISDEKEFEEISSADRKRGLISRYTRYRELLDKANAFVTIYKEAGLDWRNSNWSFASFCYECGRSGGTYLIECPGCQVVYYCSRSCRGSNWRRGHKKECKAREYSPMCTSMSATNKTRGGGGGGAGAGGVRQVVGKTTTRNSKVHKRRQTQ